MVDKSRVSSPKITVPQIKNVSDLRETVRGAVLLHFTAEQWKTLQEGLEKVEKLSEDAPILEITSMPGEEGIMLAAVCLCPPDCTPI